MSSTLTVSRYTIQDAFLHHACIGIDTSRKLSYYSSGQAFAMGLEFSWCFQSILLQSTLNKYNYKLCWNEASSTIELKLVQAYELYTIVEVVGILKKPSCRFYPC